MEMMSSQPWKEEVLCKLNEGTLVRGVERIHSALHHLGDSTSEYVETLQEGLRAMKGELARRGRATAGAAARLSARPSAAAGAHRTASASARGAVPKNAFSKASAKASSRTGRARKAFAEGVLPGNGSSEKNASQKAGSTGVGRDRPPSATPVEEEPVWRLIPHLNDTSSNIVSVLSEEGIVRYQSKPVKWLLGFEAETLVGQSLGELLCPSCEERAQEAVARMVRGEEKFDCWRLQFRTASGGSFWMEGMASNFLRDPRLNGILVYWREFVE